MARLNPNPPSENSDASEDPTVDDKFNRDREKENRNNLLKGNWKLDESQLLRHFGEAILNSRRQLIKLIAFAKIARSFTEALPYLNKARARRQAGALYRSGISKEADWLVTDIVGAMDDYKKEATARQKPANKPLRLKREASVRKDTPVKKRQRNQRQASQLPTALRTRPASRPPAAPISRAKTTNTRRAASKAPTEARFNDQNPDTVSSEADCTDEDNSIINYLLDSEDEPGSGDASVSGPEESKRRVAEAVGQHSRDNPVGQLVVLDNQMSGELRDPIATGISNGEAIEEGPTVSQEPALCGPANRQDVDDAGLEPESGDGSANIRGLPSYDGFLDQSLHPHARASDQPGDAPGLRMRLEEGRSQHSEDNLSLGEYLTREQIGISSKLRKLEDIISICDERLRIMTESQALKESHLIGYRDNARIAKERLEMAQQMEHNCVTLQRMTDSTDVTSSQQIQDLLEPLSDCRRSCQAAYERTQAELESEEMSFNTRQEHLFLLDVKKRNATEELQAWRDWQADGGKIFHLHE